MLETCPPPTLGDGRTLGAEFRDGGVRLLGASLGLGCGVALYTPVSSLFFLALEREFHWTKAAAAGSLAALPLTALALPLIGWLVDRVGVRGVALVSAACLSLGLFALSTLSGAIAQFYVLFLLMNVAGAGTGPVSYTRVIASDFRRGRGLALALSLLGIAVVAILMPLLIRSALAQGGWRLAYRELAAVTFVGGGAAALLLGVGRRRLKAAPLAGGGGETGLSLWRALGRPAFWLLAAALFCTSVASFGVTSQLQSIGIEKGFAPGRAALLISVLAVGIAPSRLLVGWLLDVTDPRRAAAGALWVAALGAAAVWLAPRGADGVVILGVLLLGGSIGAELDLMSFFCAHCFGLRRFGAVYGGLGVFFYAGIAAGGVGFGATHDRSGSYAVALAASVALLAAAGALLLGLPRRPFGPAEPAAETALV